MSQNAISKIVVGTDFNDLATAALRFTGGLAARAGAELIAVYADTFDPPAEFTAAQIQHIAETIERSRIRTRQQLETYVAKQIGKSVRWRAVVVDALPSTAISETANAEGADFIAVGTHGRGGLQRLVMGSVAEALIRESRVPVLTVRSTEIPAAVRRVLCPVNGSETAADASRYAATIAQALDAELTLLHVCSAGDDRDFDPHALVAEAPQTRVLRRNVQEGHPAPEILRIADSGDYDLVVVGVTLCGTTTAAVTRHARIPVLTVTKLRSGGPASAGRAG